MTIADEPRALSTVDAWAMQVMATQPDGAERGAVIPLHLSAAERREWGRHARERLPRRALRAWSPAADRPDPVALLREQEATRVQELLPVRHARMAVSPFTFYRGSAVVMAADLGALPTSGLTVQLCGDAHLSNFGAFAAPDRTVVFDINDFDETHPGPFEWDVLRLATSFVLAARDNGFPDEEGTAAATTAATAYRLAMANQSERNEIDLWYQRLDASMLMDWASRISSTARRRVARSVEQARARDAWSAIRKLTTVQDGRRVFLHQPPVLSRIGLDGHLPAHVHGMFRDYAETMQEDRRELLARYQIIDMGHKVVGVGSVGMLAFVLLLQGRDDSDLLAIQVKQAQASVLERYTSPSRFDQHGHRVVAGQRLMQAAGDAFLGWARGPLGRDYYLRQLRDMKWSPDIAEFAPQQLVVYARLCGIALARAHARCGDAIAIAAYLGSGDKFDRSVTDFATAYAGQVQRDYAAFTEAIAAGTMAAEEQAGGVQATDTVTGISEQLVAAGG